MGLASNVVSPARTRATPLACFLTNSSLELVMKELTRVRHEEITKAYPRSTVVGIPHFHASCLLGLSVRQCVGNPTLIAIGGVLVIPP